MELCSHPREKGRKSIIILIYLTQPFFFHSGVKNMKRKKEIQKHPNFSYCLFISQICLCVCVCVCCVCVFCVNIVVVLGIQIHVPCCFIKIYVHHLLLFLAMTVFIVHR